MLFHSTRGNDSGKDFATVLMQGLADDGGLFMPDHWPQVDLEEIKSKTSFIDVAKCVVPLFTASSFSHAETIKILEDTWHDFEHLDLVGIQTFDDVSILELFHGPTAAFKDFGLQLAAAFFNEVLESENKTAIVLGATSGDTGSAAIHAFKVIENIIIFIFHPHNSTSQFQRKQMTTRGANNVYNLAIEGTFDDCQFLVKHAFKYESLNENYNLTAVNSINWFRVLPQSIYYAWSYLNHSVDSFVVPSGNFGNIYSAYLLKKMGFPLRKLVIATNENNILHRIINNNDFTLTDVIKTNSPSMDITISSNFERILSEFIDTSSLVELYQKMPTKDHIKSINQNAHKNLSDLFVSMSANSDEVIAQIKKTYENFKLIVDPHTAVGLACAEKIKIKGAMCLACAHPVKFQDTVKKSINGELEYKKNFKFEHDEKFDVLKNNYPIMKEYIQNYA